MSLNNKYLINYIKKRPLLTTDTFQHSVDYIRLFDLFRKEPAHSSDDASDAQHTGSKFISFKLDQIPERDPSQNVSNLKDRVL